LSVLVLVLQLELVLLENLGSRLRGNDVLRQVAMLD
jgi:hypothetical protein